MKTSVDLRYTFNEHVFLDFFQSFFPREKSKLEDCISVIDILRIISSKEEQF